MYFDEALCAIRMDEKFGLPIPRYITRPVASWTGRWIEWRDGRISIHAAPGIAPKGCDRILPSDMQARDWMVLEDEA